MGKNPTQQPKLYSFSWLEKSPLIGLNLLLLKVSFLPHQIANFVAVVISVVSYFKIPALCTHVMLIWLINVYWMLPVAWQKYWIIEALPRKISIPSTFPFSPSRQCYFENPASINGCFPFFHTPFFISNFVKFQVTPLQLAFCGLWANQT